MTATLGIDVGTTSTKAVLLDPAGGRVLAESAPVEYPTSYTTDGGAEQDPGDWWAATVHCVREVLARSAVAPGDVAAVGVSSQAPSVVLLGHDGEPVRPALLWMDRRGEAECSRRHAEAERVLALTGNRLDPYFAAPKLAWALSGERVSRGSVRAAVMANGFVAGRLTGALRVDSGHAGLSLLNDLGAGGWSAELAGLWGVPASWLPPVAEPTEVIGTVTAEAAAATGLAAGTPVVAGLVDGAAASLEAGVLGHGDICEMTGQSTVVNAAVAVDRAQPPTGTLIVMPHAIPGHRLVVGAMVATGGILRWFRHEFDGGGDFAELDRLAGTAPVGSGGVILLPYFLGERSPVWDSDARGAFVGMSMSTTRADLVRAILEGTAYGLAHNLGEFAAYGLRPRSLRVVGGGAKGRTWNRIKADVTGLTVELPRAAMGAPVGTALAAAAGAGLVTDLATAARDRFEVAERISPDAARHADYGRGYAIYRDLYPALRETYRNLAALR